MQIVADRDWTYVRQKKQAHRLPFKGLPPLSDVLGFALPHALERLDRYFEHGSVGLACG